MSAFAVIHSDGLPYVAELEAENPNGEGLEYRIICECSGTEVARRIVYAMTKVQQ